MKEHNLSAADESLALTALQYIGNELSDDARSAFESRLVEDQAAREAVASAVELSLAAREVFAEDAELVAVREEVRRPVSRKAWWNVAIAASALAALVLVSKGLELGKRPPSASDAELAKAWSEARSEWPTSALQDEQAADEIDFALPDDDVALPTWMVAAVSDGGGMMEVTEGTTGDTIPE